MQASCEESKMSNRSSNPKRKHCCTIYDDPYIYIHLFDAWYDFSIKTLEKIMTKLRFDQLPADRNSLSTVVDRVKPRSVMPKPLSPNGAT
jgi:hypothetical protein